MAGGDGKGFEEEIGPGLATGNGPSYLLSTLSKEHPLSHFVIAVVTPSRPSASDIDDALAPYQERGAGCDDAYIVDVDITAKARLTYEGHTQKGVRLADGSVKLSNDECFYVMPTAEELLAIADKPFLGQSHGKLDGVEYMETTWADGSRGTRMKRYPEGAEEVVLASRDRMTFEEFVGWYYEYPLVPLVSAEDADPRDGGYATVGSDGKIVSVFDRTNPQGYWDWYEIGGRWQGYLRALGPDDAARGTAAYGRRATSGGYDMVRRGNLDVDAMKAARTAERRSWLDDIAKKADVPYSELEDAIRGSAREHEKWSELPEPRPRGAEYVSWLAANVEDGARLARVRMASFRFPHLEDGQSLEDFVEDVVPFFCVRGSQGRQLARKRQGRLVRH